MVDTVGSGMPFVATGNGGSDGGFGGGSAIWAIVLIALLGFNRNGGDCGGGHGVAEAVDNAELNARFNSLENQISNVNDLAAIRETYKESCDTNMNVTQQGMNVTREVLEAKFDNAIIAKDAQLAAQACCCETNNNILRSTNAIERQIADCCCSTNLNIERGNNAIIGAIHAEGEATRGLLVADKIEALRDKVNELQLRESQCNQNATLISALRPFPQPAFGVNAPYAPVGFGPATGYGYCNC